MDTCLMHRLKILRQFPVVLLAVFVVVTSICSPLFSHLQTQTFDTAHQSISQFEGFESAATQLKKSENGPRQCGVLVTLNSEKSNKYSFLCTNSRPCNGACVPLSAHLVYSQTVSGYL